ncbi:MAG TPA: hypothetical protein VGN80_00605 [Devosiaceae bacterium]|jgi:hypothetical protein|nr:hypothetical protein [Devosiaceae bacterium]
MAASPSSIARFSASARLRSAGVEILTEPQAAPYDPRRRVAEFRDSEGNRMVISSRP